MATLIIAFDVSDVDTTQAAEVLIAAHEGVVSQQALSKIEYSSFLAHNARQTPEQLRVAILDVLQRQANTTSEGVQLIAHFTAYVEEREPENESPGGLANETMRGLLENCAGNLAAVVDMWIDIAQKGK